MGQVNARFPAKLGNQPLQDGLVEVVATKEGVAIGGLDLEHAVAHLKDGDVKSAAAEVKDRDVGIREGLIQSVGQR